MTVTVVYIDGFNLYYRALINSPNKWLNLVSLATAVLPSTARIAKVNYYTAHVSGRTDPDAPKRQHAYLRALATLPTVALHFGKFMTNQKWAGLVPPPEFRPRCRIRIMWPRPVVAKVWKTEEKGSDVNLGAHLVRDAFQGAFQEAAVLTNDTDLCEPIRIVTNEVGLPVTLLTPVAQPHASLRAVCTHVRHVAPYLGPCQFPNPVIGTGGKLIHKPVAW